MSSDRPDHIPTNWDQMTIEALYQHFLRARGTPQSIVEAVMYCVRERGLNALKEPANRERLSRCDEAGKAQINERIGRLVEQKRLPQ